MRPELARHRAAVAVVADSPSSASSTRHRPASAAVPSVDAARSSRRGQRHELGPVRRVGRRGRVARRGRGDADGRSTARPIAVGTPEPVAADGRRPRHAGRPVTTAIRPARAAAAASARSPRAIAVRMSELRTERAVERRTAARRRPRSRRAAPQGARRVSGVPRRSWPNAASGVISKPGQLVRPRIRLDERRRTASRRARRRSAGRPMTVDAASPSSSSRSPGSSRSGGAGPSGPRRGAGRT